MFALSGSADTTPIGWVEALASAPVPEDDATKIDQIRELEVLKCAVEARQAELAAALDASQRARAAERGEPAVRQGRGIAEQVALARRGHPTAAANTSPSPPCWSGSCPARVPRSRPAGSPSGAR